MTVTDSSKPSLNPASDGAADRLDKINPFRVMTVMQRAAELEAQGRKVIHMEVGEPDFTTAAPLVAAAKAALDAGHTGYTPAPGIPQLRQKLAEHYQQNYGVSLDPARILVTPGASAGLMLLAHLLVGPGDGILLGDPAYPCVRNFIHLVQGRPLLVPVGPAENFQPTVGQLEAGCDAQTTGLWLASPANPTGAILDRGRLQQSCDWANNRGLHVLVDEIYHGLHYVDDMPTVLEVDDNSFVVNSFSKYFGMTGWRLGWIVVPEPFVEKANILAQNLYISAPSMAQYAALAAFEPGSREIFEQRRQAFRQRGDYLRRELAAMGFGLAEAVQGAFYLYADISRFSNDAEQFCQQMLEQEAVAITPGTDFGEHRARHYVRFAFTTSMENLEQGVARLRQALGQS
jgi:aspartate/methionine/tyrosine aminotransferase